MKIKKIIIIFYNILKFLRRKIFKKKNVIILSQNKSLWSIYENLYYSLKKDKSFNVILILISASQPGLNSELSIDEDEKIFFSKKKIGYLLDRNPVTGKWLNLKVFFPDFIFIQTPYDDQRYNKYSIDKLNKIATTCYIPYGIMIAGIQRFQFNLPFHKKCGLIFCETSVHKELYKKYCEIELKEIEEKVIVTGYPKFDYYKTIGTDLKEEDLWKTNKKLNPSKFKIIWSPHWTIESDKVKKNDEDIEFSCFMKYYQNMFLFVKNNKDFEFVLRPHPFLWKNILKLEKMTESQLSQFKNDWNSLENASIYEGGDYFPLFMTSDAIINSSVSFLAEYYPTKKPMLFTVGDRVNFNEYGQKIISGVYKSYNWTDVESFIKNVVVNKEDYMYNDRIKIIDKYLNISKDFLASDNIKNILNKINLIKYYG